MHCGENPYRFIVFLAGFMLAAQGCVMPVEIAPPAERQVFVKCILEKGNPILRATLLYSGGIGEKYFEPVEDAVVTVGGVATKGRDYQFQYIGEGVYEVGMEPKDGETYSLKVAIPGRDTLEATTTVPEYFSIESDMNPPEEWLLELDDPDYNVDLWMNPWGDAWVRDTYWLMKEAGRTCLLCEMPGIIFRMDTLSHHHLYVLGRMEESTGVVGHIRELATNHLLVDNVNANVRTYHMEDEPACPDTARRPRYERMTKRYYEGLPLHDGYLRIDYPKNYDNGLRNVQLIGRHPDSEIAYMDARRYFAVVGDFEYNIWGAYDHKEAHPVLYFCSVSEEYDRYLRKVQAAIADAKGDLLSTLYGEAGGYSNVRGGYGVFGAVSTLRHDCDLKYGWGQYVGYVSYPAYLSLLPE